MPLLPLSSLSLLLSLLLCSGRVDCIMTDSAASVGAHNDFHHAARITVLPRNHARQPTCKPTVVNPTAAALDLAHRLADAAASGAQQFHVSAARYVFGNESLRLTGAKNLEIDVEAGTEFIL